LFLSTLNSCKPPILTISSTPLTCPSILDYNYKTWIPIFSCLLTVSGWWAWNLFLSAAYTNTPGVYTARDAFIHHFDLAWWTVLIIVIMACAAVELILDVGGRRWWAGEVEIWQEVEMERRKKYRRRRKRGGDESSEDGGYVDEDEEVG
jgi:phospholipid-translocating ATPase